MKTRIFKTTKDVEYKKSHYTILVYGEMKEEKEIEGYYVVPIKFNGRSSKITMVDYDKKQEVAGYNQFYSRTKIFNMGWAICMTDSDKFDLETGIKIAKRRFAKSPMKTQNGRFLTNDMCESIITNEANYIANNIERYLVKDEDEVVKPIPNKDKKKEKEYTAKEMLAILQSALPKEERHVINIDDSDTTEMKKIEVVKPHDGDYVSFSCPNKKGDRLRYYLGIFKGKVRDYASGKCIRNEFYFLASFDLPTFQMKDYIDSDLFCEGDISASFNKATEEQKRIINQILQEKWNRIWDADCKFFEIIF